MDGGRRGSSRAIAGLSSACCASIALAVAGCGDAFTTAAPGGDGGSGLDAMVSPDTGADAGKGWCASQDATHTFCEDFTSGVPGMLSTELIMGGGMLAADRTDFTSAPASLLASTPGVTAVGDTATAIASKAFSGNVGMHFVLSLDLQMDSACLPKNDKNGVLVLALEFPEANYEIAIQVLPNEIDAVELTGQTPTALHQFSLTLPAGWQRWTLDVNGITPLGANTTKTVDLTIGATPVFKKETLQKSGPLLQHPVLVIGAIVKNTTGEAPACKVLVDDILFDVRAAGAAL